MLLVAFKSIITITSADSHVIKALTGSIVVQTHNLHLLDDKTAEKKT